MEQVSISENIAILLSQIVVDIGETCKPSHSVTDNIVNRSKLNIKYRRFKIK